MFHFILLMSNMMIALIFTQLNHPLAMTLIILLQTLLICLMTGLISQSFWFSYILFLVFLGGMLVLFIYITSLASNEMFIIPTKFILLSSSILMMMFLISFSLDSSLMNLNINNNDMNSSIQNSTHLYNESTMSLMKLYNNPTELITLMLVLYLFLTLIAIVKITNIFQGPLRQKN
uniref:NADH dehydrogenase subunit 6 n=1 Tax=Anabropsis tonkinensis TaxID=2986787 RepID=UPI0022385A11|nr:NADH dehydrogenase subunit 6 [Anabropsis tonkinensis]UYI31644.1 NADH dehydrogenase subunit 6 [Anabropsis tonkinensis]UYI31657.1 NADH dehydrogenase subunit 6 [Anabropsis tonkinensis]